jgi:methionyl-tRNA formyltransferase
LRILLLASKQLGLDLFSTLIKLAPEHEFLILHADDENDSRSILGKFKKVAEKNNAVFIMVNSISGVDQIVRDFQPELAFVCGWYSILSGDVLTAPRLGTWGIHHSLLPKYRGFAPLVWAIINGEEKVGSTFFRLNAGVDSGDVLFQVEVDVGPEDGISDVLAKVEKKVLVQFEKYLPKILTGQTNLISQNELESSFFPRRSSKDGEIDWCRDAVAVHDFVRAQSAPYPGAFSFFGEELIYFEHQMHGRENSSHKPGTILSRHENYLKVQTGNDSFVLIKINLNKTNVKVSERLVEGLKFNGSKDPF